MPLLVAVRSRFTLFLAVSIVQFSIPETYIGSGADEGEAGAAPRGAGRAERSGGGRKIGLGDCWFRGGERETRQTDRRRRRARLEGVRIWRLRRAAAWFALVCWRARLCKEAAAATAHAAHKKTGEMVLFCGAGKGKKGEGGGATKHQQPASRFRCKRDLEGGAGGKGNTGIAHRQKIAILAQRGRRRRRDAAKGPLQPRGRAGERREAAAAPAAK